MGGGGEARRAQTRHHPHLINLEELSAARPSGKCSFQEDFWETEDDLTWFGPLARVVRCPEVLPLPALRSGGGPSYGE